VSFITFNNLLRFEQGIKDVLIQKFGNIASIIGSTTLNTTSQTLKGSINELISRFTPAVGEIEINVTGTNPGTKYPGTTWVSWGSGKVPVGVDSAQTEFNTVEKTGGEKTHALTSGENGAHTHTGGNHYHGVGAGSYYANAVGAVPINETVGAISGSGWRMPQVPEPGTWTGSNKTGLGGVVATTSSGSGTAHNNMQPYITCYMWKRTA